jgi:integrase
MAIYLNEKKSPYYQYDFHINRRRFHGTTGSSNRREAEKIEADIRAKKEVQVKTERVVGASLQVEHVATRYWQHEGQHHKNTANTWRELRRCIEHLGATTLLSDITTKEVMALVAKRRGDKQRGKLIAPATVNHTVFALQRLFRFAKREGFTLPREPRWKDHLLKVPPERIRELGSDEREQIDAAMRADYAPMMDFAFSTGMRKAEVMGLRWSEVDWGAMQIIKLGKGGRRIVFPIIPTVAQILRPLQGDHPEFVFTFVAQRTYKGKYERGFRYPIKQGGLHSAWRTLMAKAQVKNFRFHDIRHDFATKLLRSSGNLKLVSRALNHVRPETTNRYAHVLDTDVASAIEQMQRENHRDNHREKLRVVSNKLSAKAK